MKHRITNLIEQALQAMQKSGKLDSSLQPKVQVENSRDKLHGDLASNIALTLAKAAGRKPRDIAQLICDHLPATAEIIKTEIADPGFINFFVAKASSQAIINTILNAGESYGKSTIGHGRKVQIEFVSANPTGPLHVGHGRGAAYGASLANLLDAAGFTVQREYYVNDAGRQMNILATSVWLRYLQAGGATLAFPSNGYQGDYVQTIAVMLRQACGSTLQHDDIDVMVDIPADEPDGGDKEIHIDALIDRVQQLLGEKNYRILFNTGLDAIRTDIENDLQEFGVEFDRWFSERSLVDQSAINHAINKLRNNGHIYNQDGALWFRSTDFGDDKDRVVQRDNGQTTYFAADIVYHLNKFERGFNKVINVWGADHHGYVIRIRAALQALGINFDRLIIKLVQFAILYRGQERLQMSTRSGSFVTLRQLRDEVGTDAARFFYIARKVEQHMDFDLELAKLDSKDNPVYYIQYAHARICSLGRKLADRGRIWDQDKGMAQLQQLEQTVELDLMKQLARYPDLIVQAAQAHEPHQVAHYLRQLAGYFHNYYNAHKVMIDDANLRNARICLCMATRQVLNNGLALLGVQAPEVM
jgi:arginyl-tRNA synthetase